MLGALTIMCAFLTIVLSGVLIAVFLTIKENGASKPILLTLIGFGVLFQFLVFLKASGVLNERVAVHLSPYAFHIGALPLVYLYVCSLSKRDFRFSEIRPWHILPFVIGAIWRFPDSFSGSLATSGYSVERLARSCFTVAVALPYLWAAQHKISASKRESMDSYSSLSNLRLPWLRFLVYLWHFSVIFTVLDFVIGLQVPLWFFTSFTFAAEVVGLTFYGLRYSPLFRHEFKNVSSAALPPEELLRHTNKLVSFLQSDELFLRPQLRLSDLAAALGMKNYLLTEVINRGLGTNFYDLINGLRVERAKRMLQDPKYAHMNIAGIAMESGFNSKSSFNDSFLRIAGVTPSAFRDRQASTDRHR
ncbi:MAG: helix-turn-helix domain-containing protein [Bdellovibrionota bacterium]